MLSWVVRVCDNMSRSVTNVQLNLLAHTRTSSVVTLARPPTDMLLYENNISRLFRYAHCIVSGINFLAYFAFASLLRFSLFYFQLFHIVRNSAEQFSNRRYESCSQYPSHLRLYIPLFATVCRKQREEKKEKLCLHDQIHIPVHTYSTTRISDPTPCNRIKTLIHC